MQANSNSTQPAIKIKNAVIGVPILCQEDGRVCDFLRVTESTKRNLLLKTGLFTLTEISQ